MLTWLVPADALGIACTLFANVACTLAQYVIPVAVLLYVTEKLWRRGRIEDVSHRAVLVTGCDSGFGYGLVRHLDSLGAPVYAACLTEAGRHRLKEQCSSLVTSFLMDVTSTDDVQRAYDFVQRHISSSKDGRCLWGVVNNAGILGDFGTTEMYTKADYVKVMDVNFFGQVEVIRAFLPLLKQSKGRIVNISSVSGVFPYASLGFPCPYTPSKFAVVGYSDALRHDLRKWGINVSILIPGGHRTEIMSIDGQLQRFRDMWRRLPQQTQLEYGEDWINGVCDKYKQMDSVIEGLPGPEPVVEAYAHALLSHWPRDRYVVGLDAKVMNVIRLLPQSVIDGLIQGPLNMMPLPVPAALQAKSSKSEPQGVAGTTKTCTDTKHFRQHHGRNITEQAVCRCSSGVLGAPLD